jgi:hypothetical protein
MLNWILSILVHKELLSEGEAEHLSKELTTHTHPHIFKDAHELVGKLMDEYEKKK